jgi:hypothetical protein
MPPTIGFNLRATTIFVVVTWHTIINMRVNPQFVLLCDNVHGRHADRASIVPAAAQSDTAYHSWAVLKNTHVAGFHFGMVNELCFQAAKIMEEPRRLCAFDDQGEEHCR